MVTVNLSDKNVVENVKAINEIRDTELCTDEELQKMYDNQVKKDSEVSRDMASMSNIKFEADTMGVIDYLLNEIKAEKVYNEKYDKALTSAKKLAEDDGGYYWYYLIKAGYDHSPRQSIINENTKTIRRLLLKIRE